MESLTGWLRLRPSGHVHWINYRAADGATTQCGRWIHRPWLQLTDIYPPLCKRCPKCEEVMAHE